MGKTKDDAILALVSGGIGAVLGYGSATPKINDLKAKITQQAQFINKLQFDNQVLQDENTRKSNMLVQKDQMIRRAEEQTAIRDVEIIKLKEELKKRALTN